MGENSECQDLIGNARCGRGESTFSGRGPERKAVCQEMAWNLRPDSDFQCVGPNMHVKRGSGSDGSRFGRIFNYQGLPCNVANFQIFRVGEREKRRSGIRGVFLLFWGASDRSIVKGGVLDLRYIAGFQGLFRGKMLGEKVLGLE